VAAVRGAAGVDAKRIHLPSQKQAIGIFAPGVRTREHAYYAGQIPIDLESGGVTLTLADLADAEADEAGRNGQFTVDYWDGPVLAQTREVQRQIHRLLEIDGLSFDDVVRCVVYLRSPRDLPAFGRIHGQRFGGHEPLTAIHVTDVGSISDIVLEIDVVAALPTAQPRKVVLEGGGLRRQSRDAFGVRSGNLLFLGSRVALDTTGHGIVQTAADLAGATPAGVERWGRAAPNLARAAVQTAAILNDFQSGLRAEGFSLANLRKLDIVITEFQDYVAVSETLAQYFDQPPAISVIQVPSVGPGRGAVVAMDAIGSVEA